MIRRTRLHRRLAGELENVKFDPEQVVKGIGSALVDNGYVQEAASRDRKEWEERTRAKLDGRANKEIEAKLLGNNPKPLGTVHELYFSDDRVRLGKNPRRGRRYFGI